MTFPCCSAGTPKSCSSATFINVTARIRFTNHLVDTAGVEGSDPILSGATGRLWASSQGRFRLELQSSAGDVQVGVRACVLG